MAQFQQDAGDVQFPFVPHGSPRPDTSKARVIGLLGNLGLQAVEGKIQADLVGPRQPDDAFDATDVSPSERSLVSATHDDLRQLALNDKELNLRKVALMRSQGLITAEEAVTRANMAVQSASARLPGRAAEFRQKAAAFFGDFGEGQGLLNETASEKQNRNMLQQLTLLALKNGYFPNELGEFLHVQRQFNELKLKQQKNEQQLREGKGSVDSALDLGVTLSNQFLIEFMGEINGELTANKGLVTDAAEFATRMAGVKAQVQLQLGSIMAASGSLISPTDRSAVAKSIDDYWAPVEAFVASGDMNEIFAKHSKLIQDMIKIDASRAFYAMAVANQAGGQAAVLFMLETQPLLQRMKPAKRAAFLDMNPMRAQFYDFNNQVADLLQSREDILNRFMPQRGTLRRALTNSTAKHTLTRGEDDSPVNALAADHLLRAYDEGEVEALDVFTDPRVKAHMRPVERTQLMNRVNSNLSGMAGFGGQTVADAVGIELVFQGGQFQVISGEVVGRAAPGFPVRREKIQPGSDIVKVRDELNRNLRVLRNFADTPEFTKMFEGQSPEEVLGITFGALQQRSQSLLRVSQSDQVEGLLAQFDKLAASAAKGGKAGEKGRQSLLDKIKELAAIALPEADPDEIKGLEPGLYKDESGAIFRVTPEGTVIEELNIGEE